MGCSPFLFVVTSTLFGLTPEGALVDPLQTKAVTTTLAITTRKIAEHFGKRRRAIHEQRVQELLEELSVCGSIPDIDSVLENAPDECVETFFECYEQYARAVDPSVRPFLVRLTAPRLVQRIAIDPYFRRVGSMLVAMDKQELLGVVELFSAIRSASGDLLETNRASGLRISARPDNAQVTFDLFTAEPINLAVSDAFSSLELLVGARLVSRGPDVWNGSGFQWTHDGMVTLRELLRLFGSK